MVKSPIFAGSLACGLSFDAWTTLAIIVVLLGSTLVGPAGTTPAFNCLMGFLPIRLIRCQCAPGKPAARRAPRVESLEQRTLLSGDGLTGQYFHNPDFTGLAAERTEAVSFNWG